MQYVTLDGRPVGFDQWRGRNVLVLFWRPDCSPCLTEMKVLPKIARDNSDLPIALVSLHDTALSKQLLPAMPANVQVMIARDEGTKVLAAFGNDRTMALPYSVMLNGLGNVCGRHYGILNPQKVSGWRQSC